MRRRLHELATCSPMALRSLSLASTITAHVLASAALASGVAKRCEYSPKMADGVEFFVASRIGASGLDRIGIRRALLPRAKSWPYVSSAERPPIVLIAREKVYNGKGQPALRRARTGSDAERR